MWRTGQERWLAQRFLPAMVLLATPICGPVAIPAQQSVPVSAPTAATVSPPAQALSPELIGDMRLAERRYQEAIEAYANAPNSSSEVWNKRGISYEMLFDLKDAERCFKQSLRLNPTDARVVSNLATVYESQQDHRKAERLYRRALKLAPASPLILIDLGTNLVLQDKYDQAGQMFQRAVTIDHSILESHDAPIARSPVSHEHSGAINYYKAKGFAQAGMSERAISYLRRALHEGFTSPSEIAQEPGFERLHGLPTFEKLLAEPGE
jgi:Flp pilus assembly protein TadD